MSLIDSTVVANCTSLCCSCLRLCAPEDDMACRWHVLPISALIAFWASRRTLRRKLPLVARSGSERLRVSTSQLWYAMRMDGATRATLTILAEAGDAHECAQTEQRRWSRPLTGYDFTKILQQLTVLGSRDGLTGGSAVRSVIRLCAWLLLFFLSARFCICSEPFGRLAPLTTIATGWLHRPLLRQDISHS